MGRKVEELGKAKRAKERLLPLVAEFRVQAENQRSWTTPLTQQKSPHRVRSRKRSKIVCLQSCGSYVAIPVGLEGRTMN